MLKWKGLSPFFFFSKKIKKTMQRVDDIIWKSIGKPTEEVKVKYTVLGGKISEKVQVSYIVFSAEDIHTEIVIELPLCKHSFIQGKYKKTFFIDKKEYDDYRVANEINTLIQLKSIWEYIKTIELFPKFVVAKGSPKILVTIYIDKTLNIEKIKKIHKELETWIRNRIPKISAPIV